MARWGGEGNLWLPHVYSPAQNPGDASGVNQFGRWAYGPWFWPPTNNIEYGPIANPYYDPNLQPRPQWCEPPLMPGTPYISMGMEVFNDTPVVNGTAYPTLTVDPKAYRFRILNAANDRFFNLSLYKAVDANGDPVTILTPTRRRKAPACLHRSRPEPGRGGCRPGRPDDLPHPGCRAPKARTGSRSAPRAVSCPRRSLSRPSPSPGSLTRPCSTPAMSTSTRC